MRRPKFSVVIPTRLGHATLPATLRTCLSQDHDDYEVVVVDNASLPETKAVVGDFASDRVRYFRHDEPLAMTENWNRALSYARGEWITFIGDDDALLPGALRRLDTATRQHAVSAIRWYSGVYTWPDHIDAARANRLALPLTSGERLVATSDRVAQMATGLVGPNVPSLYYGLINRSLVAKALSSGPVFEGRIPDYFSAVLLAALTTQFLEILDPLAIAGLSGKANGMAQLSDGSPSRVRRDFDSLNAKFGLRVHPNVPEIELTCVYVWDAMFRVRDRLALGKQFCDVTADRIAEVCLDALWAAEPERSAQVRTIQEFLQRSGSQGLGLQAPARSNEASIRGGVLPGGGQLGLAGEWLVIDTAPPGVVDVSGAATLSTVVLQVASTLEQLRCDIATRDQQNAALGTRIAELARERDASQELAASLAHTQKLLRRAQSRRAHAEAELRAIRRSRSWRLAKRLSETASALRHPLRPDSQAEDGLAEDGPGH